MLLQEALNTAIQLGIVLFIAAIGYLAFGRKKRDFFGFIGIVAPTGTAMLWALAASLVLIPATVGLFMLPTLHPLAAGSNTVAGQFREMGPNSTTAALVVIMAFGKTALSEEIFFRGLIAKRLIAWLGFGWGNTIHAALFGGVHLAIFVVPGGPSFNPLSAALLFSVTGAGGWLMACLNEKVGNGSIAPGWLLHGLSNAVAYPVLAFL